MNNPFQFLNEEIKIKDKNYEYWDFDRIINAPLRLEIEALEIHVSMLEFCFINVNSGFSLQGKSFGRNL